MANWLTKAEVCKELGISNSTLDRLMRSGQISYYKTSEYKSAKVRFSTEDVVNYLKKIKVN